MNETVPMFVIVGEDELTCPKCGGHDIVEVDTCERWNTIHYSEGRVSIAQSDPEFETVGLGCLTCEGALSAPEGFFDRAEWY